MFVEKLIDMRKLIPIICLIVMSCTTRTPIQKYKGYIVVQKQMRRYSDGDEMFIYKVLLSDGEKCFKANVSEYDNYLYNLGDTIK